MCSLQAQRYSLQKIARKLSMIFWRLYETIRRTETPFDRKSTFDTRRGSRRCFVRTERFSRFNGCACDLALTKVIAVGNKERRLDLWSQHRLWSASERSHSG